MTVYLLASDGLYYRDPVIVSRGRWTIRVADDGPPRLTIADPGPRAGAAVLRRRAELMLAADGMPAILRDGPDRDSDRLCRFDVDLVVPPPARLIHGEMTTASGRGRIYSFGRRPHAER